MKAMSIKMKTLVAAIAFIGAGAANAAAVMPNTMGSGGSLLFEAWDSSTNTSFTQVLGTNTFDSFFGAGQPTSSLTFSLAPLFASFSSVSDLQWHVVASKSVNDTTSRLGVLATANTTTISNNVNNNALGNAAQIGSNNSYTYINTMLAAPGNTGDAGVSNSTTDPTAAAYAGRTTWGPNFGVPGFGAVNAITGFYTGTIAASTVYAPQAGVGAFFSYVNSGGSGTTQSTKSVFGNSLGNASWILQSNGTLTYHVAEATSVVPIPAAAWLFGSGLLGLVGIARRRKNGQ